MAENLDNRGWTAITIRVPPELQGYGPSLIRFFDAMIFKLRRNAHKGKWEAVPLDRAMTALMSEAAELKEAVAHGNTMEVLMEGADVANQALIVAEIKLEVREPHLTIHLRPNCTPGHHECIGSNCSLDEANNDKQKLL